MPALVNEMQCGGMPAVINEMQCGSKVYCYCSVRMHWGYA
jgi:hypothetical protein